jgi:hypothetical protein
MTSGNSIAPWRRRALCLLALALSPPGPAAPPEAAPDAAALIASLARSAPARTAYTEVRFSGLLERPLILRGELEYLGPGRLGKSVAAPYREQTRIADGQATVQRGERAPRTFALSQAPELEGFLRGFAALLGGDAAALERDFTIAASGVAANWRLVLTPRDARLARRISTIEVDGAGREPRCFRTRDADGDVGVLLVDALAETKLPVRVLPSQVETLCRGGKAP